MLNNLAEIQSELTTLSAKFLVSVCVCVCVCFSLSPLLTLSLSSIFNPTSVSSYVAGHHLFSKNCHGYNFAILLTRISGALRAP